MSQQVTQEHTSLVGRAYVVGVQSDVKELLELGLADKAEKLVTAYEKRNTAETSKSKRKSTQKATAPKVKGLQKTLETALQDSKASRVIKSRISNMAATNKEVMSKASVDSNYTLESSAAQRTILILYSQGLLSEEYSAKIKGLL